MDREREVFVASFGTFVIGRVVEEVWFGSELKRGVVA